MMNRAKNNAKPALQRAVDWLSVRDYSEKQLGDKLRRNDYPDDEIAATLNKLRERRYLDDRALCLRQCRAYLSEARQSLLAIRCKLQAKGFSKALITESLEQLDTADYGLVAAMHLLRLRFGKAQPVEKYCQYLYRKGFSSGDSLTAARQFAAEKQQAIDLDEV